MALMSQDSSWTDSSTLTTLGGGIGVWSSNDFWARLKLLKQGITEPRGCGIHKGARWTECSRNRRTGTIMCTLRYSYIWKCVGDSFDQPSDPRIGGGGDRRRTPITFGPTRVVRGSFGRPRTGGFTGLDGNWADRLKRVKRGDFSLENLSRFTGSSRR